MPHPLITIGIISFNAEATIVSAVLSAHRQNWANKEIVVVDDASTDNTLNILSDLLRSYPELTVIKVSKNMGVAASRNRLIKEAKGDFIAFFDDDDSSLPDRIASQYQRITQYESTQPNGTPILCHTARTQNYPDGISRYEPTMGMDKNGPIPNGEAIAQRILTGKPVPGIFGSTATCSQMARTSVYRDLGGFDPAFRRSEDTEFNIRLSLSGGHFIGIIEPLVIQTMTLANDKTLCTERACYLQLLDKHKIFIDQKSSYSFCYGWIDAKYDFLSGHKLLFIKKLVKLFIKYPIDTTKRLYWAIPNISFNLKFLHFHHE